MWKPKVLSEYEIGKVMAAIEDVSLRNKPIVDVGMRYTTKVDLAHDLRACMRQAPRGGGRVFFFIHKEERKGLFSYGFYAHKCMLDALNHMTSSNIDPRLRHVFLGLVFGYSPSAISWFVERDQRRRKSKKRIKKAVK